MSSQLLPTNLGPISCALFPAPVLPCITHFLTHPLRPHLRTHLPPTEIGIGLTSFGVLFTLLGVMLFFDRGLLSMGNVLFLSGVTTTIGPRRTYKFFKRNSKGTAAFMGGVSLVFVGWPFFGMLVEGYGFLVLFSSFFPTVLLFLKRLPVIGTFLSLPGVKNVVTTLIGRTQTLPV
jgi:hypothetical protein